MVMIRNMMRKNLYQSIWRSLGRYLAIVAIIALGSSMFVGLLMTKTDMVATGQVYMEQQNMFDLRLISAYGWDPEHLDEIRKLDGVVDAEGLTYTDLIVHTDEDTSESVYRFYAIPEKINQIVLLGGRMPEAPNECLADGYHTDASIIGTTYTLADTNSEDALESMTETTYTVVGYISTPLYMDMNRGTTSVGNGSISNYLFLPAEAFSMDYYAEIHVTIPGSYDLYSDAYNDAMEAAAERLEPQIKPFAQKRLDVLKQEAEEAYADGLRQYKDGVKELKEAREEVEKELQEALEKLEEAEQLIADNEAMIAEGEAQIADGRAQLAEGEKALEEGRAEFESSKESMYAPLDSAETMLRDSYDQIRSRYQILEAELAAIDRELAELNALIAEKEAVFADITAEIEELDSRIAPLNSSIPALETALAVARLFPAVNADVIAQLEAMLADQIAQRSALQAQRAELEAKKEPYMGDLEEPYARRDELNSERSTVNGELAVQKYAMDAASQGLVEIENARVLLDEQFAGAEAELLAGEQQLNEAREELRKAENDLAYGRQQLEEGKQELEDGWKDYYEGKAKAEMELADAEQELADAKEELDDARKMLDEMTDATVYVMDRNTNIGYNSLDSASDIVWGVSRVFPAFFLLVAAMVCITTMTRMIDEERTQIGTLKALGYSNSAIISKYLIYAGSGAVIGCGLGVTVGSMAFPKILWEAYKIMLFITDGIVLRFNWGLCAAVVGVYTAAMLLVTWYCCRRTLQEEPAELIRPKAPDAGKKILLEYLPFWGKISFLNKVTIRNIFRYRQRLAMMMLGIGGCTALLLTGFGLRDSIVNVVDYQFQEVTPYDMTVYFEDGRTEEEQSVFLEEMDYGAENILFYHQSSVELDFDNQTKELYLIAAGSGVEDFIDFHTGNQPLSLPGENEVLLSVGAAEAMGIRTGDTVVLRNADMEILELTVSGIYDNHVENYAIIAPQTIKGQWGREAELQMAFVKVTEDQDVHSVAAQAAGLDGVLNVSVSEDFAAMVGNMMDALDLVVWVIVVCAGLLAAIVLYNLTNINITERLREIATIKVLGFNASETAAYVFKENLTLSAFGSVFGLGLGYLLLLFVMSQIKIDMVWFKALIMPASYLWSVVLTMVAACVVDFIFYFKLEKINMAEALKSVE